MPHAGEELWVVACCADARSMGLRITFKNNRETHCHPDYVYRALSDEERHCRVRDVVEDEDVDSLRQSPDPRTIPLIIPRWTCYLSFLPIAEH